MKEQYTSKPNTRFVLAWFTQYSAESCKAQLYFPKFLYTLRDSYAFRWEILSLKLSSLKTVSTTFHAPPGGNFIIYRRVGQVGGESICVVVQPLIWFPCASYLDWFP